MSKTGDKLIFIPFLASELEWLVECLSESHLRRASELSKRRKIAQTRINKVLVDRLRTQLEDIEDLSEKVLMYQSRQLHGDNSVRDSDFDLKQGEDDE